MHNHYQKRFLYQITLLFLIVLLHQVPNLVLSLDIIINIISPVLVAFI